MADTLVEKEACPKCGAEVRDETTFCYACGARLGGDESTNGKGEIDGNSQAALDDLAERLGADDRSSLERAATERKKARVSQRKSREFVWEPRTDMPQGLFIAATAAFVLAVFVVVVLVVWK